MTEQQNFQWRDYARVSVEDPNQRAALERTLDLIAQTPEGRTLLQRARDNVGIPVEIRTDGRFTFGDRSYDVSGQPGRAIIQQDGRDGWGSGIQIDPTRFARQDVLAQGGTSLALTGTLGHELHHIGNPQEHPRAMYQQFVDTTEQVARDALARSSNLPTETRDQMAREMAEHMRQQLGITPENMGTLSLETSDLHHQLDHYLRGNDPFNRSMMEARARSYGPGYAFSETVDDFIQRAAARHGVSESDIRVDTSAGPSTDGPLYEAGRPSSDGSTMEMEACTSCCAGGACGQHEHAPSTPPATEASPGAERPQVDSTAGATGDQPDENPPRTDSSALPTLPSAPPRPPGEASSMTSLTPRQEGAAVRAENELMSRNFCDSERQGYSDHGHMSRPDRQGLLEGLCRPAGIEYSPTDAEAGQLGSPRDPAAHQQRRGSESRAPAGQ